MVLKRILCLVLTAIASVILLSLNVLAAENRDTVDLPAILTDGFVSEIMADPEPAATPEATPVSDSAPDASSQTEQEAALPEVLPLWDDTSVSDDAPILYASSGSCGTNATYTLANGTLTISGTGPMTNFSYTANIPWYSVRSTIKTVVIESGITSIGSKSFLSCKNLTGISIPGTVTAIRGNAFDGCTSLTSLSIPSGVTEIGSFAFQDCAALRSVYIPASVTTLDTGIFLGCTQLTSAGPSSGTYNIEFGWKTAIPRNAFRADSQIANAVIPEGITTLDYGAFLDCSALTSVTLPSTLTTIASQVFCNTALTEIVLPPAVSSIGTEAFAFSSSLKKLVILNKNCSISDFARTLGVPGTTVIYGYAGSTAQTYAKNHGYTFRTLTDSTVVASGTCGTNLIWTLTLDGQLTISGSGAMTGYSSTSPAPWKQYAYLITSVSLPEGLTSVSAYAFSGCTGVTDITVPNPTCQLPSAGKHTFGGGTAVLHAPVGSPAEAYAEKYGYAFHRWDDGTQNPDHTITYSCTYCDETTVRHIPGDIDRDGDCDSADLVRLMLFLIDSTTEVNEPATDPNSDGITNLADLIRLVRHLADRTVIIV